MNATRHDFARPGKLAGELEQLLTTWLKAATALASRSWVKALVFEATLAPGAPESARPGDALARLPDPALAYRILLAPDALTLLVFPRPVVLAMVAGLQGDAGDTSAADQELTTVEESLWQFFLQEHLLPGLQGAWPGAGDITPRLQQREPNPQWTRIFADAGNVVVCPLVLRGPFGEQTCYLLLPFRGMVGLLGETSRQPGAAPAISGPASPLVEALVRELPVEIAVSLGTAEISLQQLARLGVGDMLVLDQRVSEPLTAAVGGGKKLRGWAGRVGAWKAFQIVSLTGG
jgi:flagellar motor switch protein FliM